MQYRQINPIKNISADIFTFECGSEWRERGATEKSGRGQVEQYDILNFGCWKVRLDPVPASYVNRNQHVAKRAIVVQSAMN